MAHRDIDGIDRTGERTDRAAGPQEGTAPDEEPQPLSPTAARDLFADRAPLGLVRLFEAAVPLVLDGEPVEDEERMHADLAGPLHLTPLGRGNDTVLAAFTDRALMLEAVRRVDTAYEELTPEQAERARASFEKICVSNPTALDARVCFFEDAGEQGDVKCLGPGLGYPNLSRLSRGFLGTRNWNDVISSLSWCRFDVSLFDAFDWQGNEFFAPKGCTTPDLSRFGWGDRTASIVNWGS
ncbi:hypothetical protein [Streptomyces thermolilacinus]|uniref:Uncharacterized protein n=1 Tax=Streptomyces thermolilacinus SPC6 TaxID=1306406 RepID=A0A1D3DMM5_9ACTN|nr:hypothetical protein [Streptomyces thermolilacinus]OEJ93569.1 hypothetical protein J116_002925 [Streptomyces thermolilacinus SPC6]